MTNKIAIALLTAAAAFGLWMAFSSLGDGSSTWLFVE
jgi:hypothetical protein